MTRVVDSALDLAPIYDRRLERLLRRVIILQTQQAWLRRGARASPAALTSKTGADLGVLTVWALIASTSWYHRPRSAETGTPTMPLGSFFCTDFKTQMLSLIQFPTSCFAETLVRNVQDVSVRKSFPNDLPSATQCRGDRAMRSSTTDFHRQQLKPGSVTSIRHRGRPSIVQAS